LPELLLVLGEPLGWKEEEYRGNIGRQDDFLEELNITTYNNFKDYLFWDVIQSLTKVYLVNTDMRSDSTNAGNEKPESFVSENFAYDDVQTL
jgi:hypothetical protein